MGMDATRKLPEEGFHRPWPERIGMDPEVQARADKRLKEWGLL
jgi:4-hydroxy-3-polyprenylbenzoate decarboxylase